jgi:hypothetical protein
MSFFLMQCYKHLARLIVVFLFGWQGPSWLFPVFAQALSLEELFLNM